MAVGWWVTQFTHKSSRRLCLAPFKIALNRYKEVKSDVSRLLFMVFNILFNAEVSNGIVWKYRAVTHTPEINGKSLVICREMSIIFNLKSN